MLVREALTEGCERLEGRDVTWLGLTGARLDVLRPIAPAAVEFVTGEPVTDETPVVEVARGEVADEAS